MPAQVVGTHFQSVPEPGLFMCMRCHYMETSTGKLTPSVHPFKAMDPAAHHHLAAWDEASDMLSTQGSLSGSLNEEDYLYMGHQPEQDLSGLPDDPSSQVRSRAWVNAAPVGGDHGGSGAADCALLLCPLPPLHQAANHAATSDGSRAPPSSAVLPA